MYTNLDGSHELDRLRPLRCFRLDIVVIDAPIGIASLLPQRRRPRRTIHRVHIVVGTQFLGVDERRQGRRKAEVEAVRNGTILAPGLFALFALFVLFVRSTAASTPPAPGTKPPHSVPLNTIACLEIGIL